MTEQVQGGTVNQETGEHILGSGLADEVYTAYTSAKTHYTHTGALQTTKKSEDIGITISKRLDEEAFDNEDEEYGQILATSEQVYEYLKDDPNFLKQWENTVSLHRDTDSRDSFVGIRNVEYPQQFFKKDGVWYKTVLQYVTANVYPLLATSTAENLKRPVQIIMWKYIPGKDVFEKVPGELIGTDQALFQNRDFKLALGKSTRQQALLETYKRILGNEERFYNNEKLLDAQELAQLKVKDAQFTAAEAAKGNVLSRAGGNLALSAVGALSLLAPAAPVAAASAAPVAAYSAAGAAAAAAASAAAGTSAASAAPLTLTGAAAAFASVAAAAPLATAAAAASAAAGVGGLLVSQFGQSTANAAVVSAETELGAARRAVETSRAAAAAQPPAQVVQAQVVQGQAQVAQPPAQADQNAKTLINGLTESNARRQTFANVAQQHRILHQGRTPNSANQTKRTLKRSLKSKSKRKPKSKCKKYQSRSRKTGHCRNKSKSRSPCKSGKARKGTGRCHKSKA
jgi:hypothetical protein